MSMRVCILLTFLLTTNFGFAQESITSDCMGRISEKEYRKGPAELAQIQLAFRRFAQSSENPLGVGARSFEQAFAPTVEYTKVSIASAVCGNLKKLNFDPKTCNELHCEDPILNFPNQPVGAKVTLESCEFPTSLVYTWQKQSNGKWRLIARIEHQVQQCPAIE